VDFSPGPVSEQDRPTGVSDDSDGLSVAEPSKSIRRQPKGGANTVTASSTPV